MVSSHCPKALRANCEAPASPGGPTDQKQTSNAHKLKNFSLCALFMKPNPLPNDYMIEGDSRTGRCPV